MPLQNFCLVLVAGAAVLLFMMRRDSRRTHAETDSHERTPEILSSVNGRSDEPAPALPADVSSRLPGVGALELPLLADSGGQLLALCSEPDCPPHEIAGAIEHDPTLSSHALRVADSAAYAPMSTIESLPPAVMESATTG